MDYTDIIYSIKNKPYTDYPKMLVEYLFQRFKMRKSDDLLDIGSGRGEYLNLFGDMCFVAGIDKEPVFDLRVKILDIETEKFNIPKDSIDIVFAKSVIEHLYNPTNFIEECYNVLKPNGILIIMTPDWDKQNSVFYEDPTHVHPYTKKSIKDLLKINLFKKVKSEIFYHYPPSWSWPILKYIRLEIPIKIARWLTKITKIKYFRWMNDKTVLGYGVK